MHLNVLTKVLLTHLQEALMYVDWPAYILSLPGFQEVTDPITQQLLLRGPRLRMGISEGPPSNVLPDHMGHANYTGVCVRSCCFWYQNRC